MFHASARPKVCGWVGRRAARRFCFLARWGPLVVIDRGLIYRPKKRLMSRTGATSGRYYPIFRSVHRAR